MKSVALLFALTVGAAMVIGTPSPAKASVDVTIYKDHTQVGDGTPFSTPWAEFVSPDVAFGTNNAWHWQPTELLDWGATIDGCFTAQESGYYTFGLVSDDGSTLWLNNSLVVDHSGEAPTIYEVDGAPVFLNAGDDLPLLINYFEDFRGDAGLDLMVKGPGDNASRLATAQELTCADTPEPCSLALLGIGGLPLLLRRRKTT